MAEKLYYTDSHIHEFTAAVTACEKSGKGYRIALDRTAFFPEGGGQLADTGKIGGVRVLDVQEKDGEVWHYCDGPLEVGSEFDCALDWEQRRRRMQNHSGEHIVSGISHRLHGVENVGFHMGEEFMTIDFDKELSWDELMEIEKLANEAVRDNIPVRAWFPDAESLKTLSYRSKLELTENVRIVEIEGVDRCACCAPHVKRTGEVGVIKILDSMRHRGGVRLSLICGMDALDNFRCVQKNVTAVSKLLSAKREDAGSAVERVLGDEVSLKGRVAALSMELVSLKAAAFEMTDGNIAVFDSILDEVALRELVNALTLKCGGIAAAFSGSDEEGYRYIIGSRTVNLREQAKIINAGIGGRGGGSPEMIQGRASRKKSEIQKFIEEYRS
ncbi:MAG: alanyl-tRNA editing protein [Candidatus Limivicinus sp.]|jgi:alanyl-tRNA synthetase